MSAEQRMRDALDWAIAASPRAAALMDGAPPLTFGPRSHHLRGGGPHTPERWDVWQHAGQISLERSDAEGLVRITLSLPRDLRLEAA